MKDKTVGNLSHLKVTPEGHVVPNVDRMPENYFRIILATDLGEREVFVKADKQKQAVSKIKLDFPGTIIVNVTEYGLIDVIN